MKIIRPALNFLRRRLERIARKRQRAFLAMPVDKAPLIDSRSSIDRFRRESGQR